MLPRTALGHAACCDLHPIAVDGSGALVALALRRHAVIATVAVRAAVRCPPLVIDTTICVAVAAVIVAVVGIQPPVVAVSAWFSVVLVVAAAAVFSWRSSWSPPPTSLL